MPITKSAIKKERADRRKHRQNKKIASAMKSLLKKARNNPTSDSVSEAYSVADLAVKRGVIKKNKAARLKARLVKYGKTKTDQSPFGKSEKKVAGEGKKVKAPARKKKAIER